MQPRTENLLIVISRKSLIFNRLKEKGAIPAYLGGSYTEDVELVPPSFSGEPAELPLPLQQVWLSMMREEEYYSGKVVIVTSGKSSFKGLSQILKEGFRKQGANFMPTQNWGLGILNCLGIMMVVRTLF